MEIALEAFGEVSKVGVVSFLINSCSLNKFIIWSESVYKFMDLTHHVQIWNSSMTISFSDNQNFMGLQKKMLIVDKDIDAALISKCMWCSF